MVGCPHVSITCFLSCPGQRVFHTATNVSYICNTMLRRSRSEMWTWTRFCHSTPVFFVYLFKYMSVEDPPDGIYIRQDETEKGDDSGEAGVHGFVGQTFMNKHWRRWSDTNENSSTGVVRPNSLDPGEESGAPGCGMNINIHVNSMYSRERLLWPRLTSFAGPTHMHRWSINQPQNACCIGHGSLPSVQIQNHRAKPLAIGFVCTICVKNNIRCTYIGSGSCNHVSGATNKERSFTFFLRVWLKSTLQTKTAARVEWICTADVKWRQV